MRTRTTRCLTGRLTGLTAALMLTSTLSAVAQTPYVPYFGKNQIRYDNFRWHIYTTDHFEIYYYPEIEQHLERVAGYAESAYQQVSADLKHDLAFKIPLILFKTSSEFQQQNVIPARRRKAWAPLPSRSGIAWCCRLTSRPTCSTAWSCTSSRTSSSSTSSPSL